MGSAPSRDDAARTRRADWWVHGAVPVAVVHGALVGFLRSRPGEIAIPLWTWGPPLVIVSAAVLLAGSLVSAWRGFGWTWKRTAAFAILAGLVITLPVYRTFPSAYDDTPSDVLMDLPLEGPVTVAWGGRSPGRNYHVGSPAERWAFDLLITVDGVSHRNAGKV
ncbi:MAG: hypothetical protein AB7F99_15110, partial [Vicinamibacterales bacterium]